MIDEIERIRRLLSDTNTYYAECIAEREDLKQEVAELRRAVKTAVFADSAELKDVKRDNDELRGLLREAWVKMDANNLWSNLRTRIAAALKENTE